MKSEFEKLIGRTIPGTIYDEIERQYMDSEKEKREFANEWTAEKIDALICERFFEAQMKELKFESIETGYQNRIKELQSTLNIECENKRHREQEAWDLRNEVARLEETITKLKASLYDKKSA